MNIDEKELYKNALKRYLQRIIEHKPIRDCNQCSQYKHCLYNSNLQELCEMALKAEVKKWNKKVSEIEARLKEEEAK